MSNLQTICYLQEWLHASAAVALLTRGLTLEGYARQNHTDGVYPEDPAQRVLVLTLSVSQSNP